MVTTKEYQDGIEQLRPKALRFVDLDLVYATLALNGEAGEVAEVVKKIARDNPDGIITDESRDMLIKELGDVMWGVAAVSNRLGVSIDEVMERNLNKMRDRKARGTLHGWGNDR